MSKPAQTKTTMPDRSREAKADWRKVKLGEVAGVLGGFAFKSEWFNTQKIGLPAIKIQSITDGSVDVASAEYVDITKVKRDISKFRLHKGDFLVAMTGATAGKVGLLAEETPCYLNQRVGKFYAKDENVLGKKFLYYSVINPRNLNLLKKLADGSAQGNMSSSQIEDVLEIFLPNGITSQKRIADILSAFDDKIDLNNNISRTLEQMVQAIFKKWFVDPADKWPKSPFVDQIEILGGGTPSTTNRGYWNGNIPFFTPGDAGQDFYVIKTEKNITEPGLQNCNSKLFPKETVFITARGTVGKVVLAGVPMAMNQSCYAFESKDLFSDYFIFLLAKRAVRELQKQAVGGVFDTITTATFRSMEVALPDSQTLKKFDQMIAPIFERILSIKKENQKLAALRDLLLPKLMSGEIRV